MKKSYVFLSDGLGNQLFQLAFCHALVDSGHQVKVVASPESFHPSRPLRVEKIVDKCEHLQYDQSRSSKIMKKIADKIKIYARLHKNLRFFIRLIPRVNIEKEYQHSRYHKGGLQIGYFQHSKYVERSKCLIEDIKSTGLISDKIISKYPVLHIRGGDFKNLAQSFGLLGSSYYLNIVNNILQPEGYSRCNVITDDVEYAKSMLLGADFKFIFHGPNELGDWDSMKLMSESPLVIASNSTFSWWGGLFSLSNGGRCIIPHPWFLNFGIVGTALHHPGFLKTESTF